MAEIEDAQNVTVPTAEVEEEPQRQNVVFTEVDEDEKKLPLGFKRAKFNADEKETILNMICGKIDEIQTARVDLGLEEQWRNDKDQYDGILAPKEYPSDKAANFNIPLTAEKVDTVYAQTEKAMFFNKPIIGIEPSPFESHEEEPGVDVEISERKEEFLDLVMHSEVPIKEGSELGRHESILHGTGWLNLSWVYRLEPQGDDQIYEGIKDLAKFKANYPDWEDDKDKKRIVRNLEKNKRQHYEVEFDAVVENNPKPRSVSIWNLYIHPLEESVETSSFLAEKQCWVGNDLIAEQKAGFFEKAIVDEIKESFTEDEGAEDFSKLFQNREFTVWRVLFKYSKKDDDIQRKYLAYVIYNNQTTGDYSEENKQGGKWLLEIFNYPWYHNRWDYIKGHISWKQEAGIYRAGLALMLRDPQTLANVAYDIMFDCAIAQVIPSWKGRASNKKQVAGELSKGHYAGVVYWLDNPETDLIANEVSGRNIQFMEHIVAGAEKMAGDRSGVSSGLSGRSLPQDPTAPAQKEAILLGQANIRISPFLDQLQSSFLIESAYQSMELYYQFKPSGVRYRAVGGNNQVAFPEIPREALRRREYYIPMGTAEMADDQQRLQKVQYLVDLSLKHPDIQQRAKTRMFLLEEAIKAMGFRWARRIGKVLPTEEELYQEQLGIAKDAVRQVEAEKAKAAQDEQESMRIRVETRSLLEQGYTPEQATALMAEKYPMKGGNGMMPQPQRPPV